MATYEEGTPPKGDFAPFRAKMEAEGLGPEVTSAFENVYSALVSGATGTIPEASITPVESLASFESDISGKVAADTSLLDKTVVLKLKGEMGRPDRGVCCEHFHINTCSQAGYTRRSS
jgi:hypothetical protein